MDNEATARALQKTLEMRSLDDQQAIAARLLALVAGLRAAANVSASPVADAHEALDAAM